MGFPAPGTILWAIDVENDSDVFRMGAATKPNVEYLRYTDLEIGSKDGRITEEFADQIVVKPGYGISLFLERMIPEGMVPVATNERAFVDKKRLQKVHWWGIDQGHPIPTGLKLVYDGHPEGHCTLTVERAMTVKAFLTLVAMVPFSPRGIEFYTSIY